MMTTPEEKKEIVDDITKDIMMAVWSEEYRMSEVPSKIRELVTKAYDLGCSDKMV